MPLTYDDALLIRNNILAAFEHALQVATWFADEKFVLAATALFWVAARTGMRDDAVLRRADHMLCCVVLASALPHLLKRLVRRRRPDRTVVHGNRRGIPRSGNACSRLRKRRSTKCSARGYRPDTAFASSKSRLTWRR